MNRIAMKTLTITLMTAILLASSMTVLVNATTPPPNWDVTGNYLTDITQDGVEGIWEEELILVQDGSDITDGSIALYPSGNSLWVFDEGSVSGDTIVFSGEATFTTLEITFTGTINSDGSMSGEWADDAPGTRTGKWETTEGNARALNVVTLDFPEGSDVDTKITVFTDTPPCLQLELPGASNVIPYIGVQVTGTFDGMVQVTVQYDYTKLPAGFDEGTLRLFIYNCVDFNDDGTINGKDMKLIKSAIEKGLTPDDKDNPAEISFDVNNDGFVDWTDHMIVKEYATEGLILNQGRNQESQVRLPWIDITMGEVDTTNHIIYGETGHFSIFRCR